jgi:hypothetical protein
MPAWCVDFRLSVTDARLPCRGGPAAVPCLQFTASGSIAVHAQVACMAVDAASIWWHIATQLLAAMHSPSPRIFAMSSEEVSLPGVDCRGEHRVAADRRRGRKMAKRSRIPRAIRRKTKNSGKHSFIQQWCSYYRLWAVAEYDFLSCYATNFVWRMITVCAGLGAWHRDEVGSRDQRASKETKKIVALVGRTAGMTNSGLLSSGA